MATDANAGLIILFIMGSFCALACCVVWIKNNKK